MGEVYYVVILPNPANVEFMQARGMPATGSPEFVDWFKTQAKDAYLEYLVLHPGYVVTVVFRDLLIAFGDTAQPYFNTGNLPWRNVLAPIGDALHPETPSPFFLDVILLLGMWSMALKRKIPGAIPWAWLATWLFLIASLNITVVILGDSFGLTRHALLATTAYRLIVWVFLIVLIDLALHTDVEKISGSRLEAAAVEAA
jgi:hypothetical protein